MMMSLHRPAGEWVRVAELRAGGAPDELAVTGRWLGGQRRGAPGKEAQSHERVWGGSCPPDTRPAVGGRRPLCRGCQGRLSRPVTSFRLSGCFYRTYSTVRCLLSQILLRLQASRLLRTFPP